MATTIIVDIFGDSENSMKFVRHTGSPIFIGKLFPREHGAQLLAVKSHDGSYYLIQNGGKHHKPIQKKIIQQGSIFKIVTVKKCDFISS
jgi:hypothetical protein